MQDFNDILNGVTDGTKDLTMNALTVNGAANFKGTVTLGDATADDITVTGSLASSVPIKTTNTYDIGSSTKGLAGVYFGANSQTVRLIGSSSMSATWTMTLPVTAGSANNILTTNGSGVTSWTAITAAALAATSTTAGTVTREASGTFTATLTGVSASVTDGWFYNVVGKTVQIVSIADLSGTSNSTAMTITGYSGPLPTHTNRIICYGVTNNGTSTTGMASFGTDGTITFSYYLSASNLTPTFTNTGTKGIAQQVFTFSLN